MKLLVLITLCIPVLLHSCRSGKEERTTKQDDLQKIKDLHSFANFNDVRVTHLDLDIAVDFDKRQLSGVAHWMFENKTGDSLLILDSDELHIDSVVLDDGSKAAFSFGAPKPYMGRALNIPIKPNSGKVSVYYNTIYNPTDTFVALQWLDPAQTLGKKAPFLYTQSEPNFARSWYPCQDAPSVKFTYNATIRVPKGLTAVMSAVNPQKRNEEGIYTFSMKQKITSYLVALAAGDIAFKPIDSRTGVYAEPAMLDKAATEFSELPQMLDVAEKLCGTYDWDRYDVLVLPPGFPIGGMENPRLTFATPTIIAGDKSLVSLIAHELAHSWSGNLVTNATWNDLWLNEGFTVYFERRIIEAIRGKDYTDMLWTIGFQDLEAAFDDFKEEKELTKLKLDLEDSDPAISLSDVAYEKGALFLWSVEKAVGRERFDAFLKEYFKTYRFRSITTEDFIQFFEAQLLKGDAALESKIKYKDWIYKEGLPADYPRPGDVRFKAVEQQLDSFEKSGNAGELKTEGWSTHEWLHFLRKMSSKTDKEGMAALDGRFRLSESTNSEIACTWFINAVRRNYSPAYPAMERFLFLTGRQKFLQPLYEEMMKQPATVGLAGDIYKKSRNNYHPIASQNIGKIVNQ